MSQYLLDTNICVFYLRGKFDVDQRMDQVGWENCFISEITMLELKMGAELSKQKDGIDRSKRLNEFLSDIQIAYKKDQFFIIVQQYCQSNLLNHCRGRIVIKSIVEDFRLYFKN